MNTIDGAIRHDLAIGESLAVGSDIVVRKKIINYNGESYTKTVS